MAKVFVVILNFNGFKNSIECINSLLKINSDGISPTIVLVDNGSEDGSVQKIAKEFGEKIVILENKTNLGFAGGNNEGMRYALKSGADYVVLLNNDTIVDRNLFKNLLEPFTRDALDTPHVGVVVPKIYFEKGFEFHKTRYKKSDLGRVIWYAGGEMDFRNLIGRNIGVDDVDRGQFDVQNETELATGCCLMIHSGVLENIGLFDDRYFLYYEDADLSERIKKAGFKIVYEPEAIVWHKNAESSGVGSDLHDYYITRNRLLFGMTYAPIRTKIALVRESLNLFRGGRKWQKRGVIDFYLHRFGRGSFPI